MMNNIVMCHPEGQMSDRRKEKLNQSCYPYFKSTQKSASQGTTLEYTVPSDIHMFWESSSSSNTSSMNELLSFVLVGHKTPPNVSKYCDKIKRVVFFGHICRVETTMEIVSQLKQCESVEFILGSKDQLPIYYRDPFSHEKAKSSCNKTVKLVSIKSSCSQVKDSPDSSPEFEAKQSIVLTQLETILKAGSTVWPSVVRLSLELPDDGVYLDMVKRNLLRWKNFTSTHSVEVKNGKLILVLKPGGSASPMKPYTSSPRKETTVGDSSISCPGRNDVFVCSWSKDIPAAPITKREHSNGNQPLLNNFLMNSPNKTGIHNPETLCETPRPLQTKASMTNKAVSTSNPLPQSNLRQEPCSSSSSLQQSKPSSSSYDSSNLLEHLDGSDGSGHHISSPGRKEITSTVTDESEAIMQVDPQISPSSVPSQETFRRNETIAGTVQHASAITSRGMSGIQTQNHSSPGISLESFNELFERRPPTIKQPIGLHNPRLDCPNNTGISTNNRNNPPRPNNASPTSTNGGVWKEFDNSLYKGLKSERSIVLRGVPESLEGQRLAMSFMQSVFPPWNREIKNIRVGKRKLGFSRSRLLRIPMNTSMDVERLLNIYNEIKPYTDNGRTISVDKYKDWMGIR